jgi:phage tail P2-like protein
MTTDTLLPHNATPLERALEQSTARLGDIALPIRELWDPATCPLDLLPWLAWALSTDRWETHWSEDQKRDAVANAIERQRKKGTPASIDAVLASFDALLSLTEWFEMQPRGEAHTFDVTLPLLLEDGTTGGFRTSAEFAEAIIRDVTRTKPARSHFRLLQSLEAAGLVDIIGVGRTAGFVRLDTAADTTIETAWHYYLQDNNGEPLQDENGDFIILGPLPAFLIYPDFSVALDFARASYWQAGTEAASLAAVTGYSFARSGEQGAVAGDGSIDYFAANTPAITEKGFQNFAAITNSAPHSTNLENVNFLMNCTVTANAAAAPDGTVTADKLIADNTTNRHFTCEYYAPPSAPRTYTVSAFLKAAGRSHAALGLSNAGGFWTVVGFNLATGAVDGPSIAGGGMPAGVGHIIPLPNGWYRCIFIVTLPDPTFAGYLTVMSTAGGDPVFEGAVGNGVDGCYVWQSQILEGVFPDGGPIIRTNGAAATIGGSDLRADYTMVDGDQLFWATADLQAIDSGANTVLANFTSPSGAEYLVLVLQGATPVVQVGVTSGLVINHFGAAQTPGVITLAARRHAGKWRGGMVRDGVLTWFAAEAVGAFPVTTKLHAGNVFGLHETKGALTGIFNKPGTFDTDAKVLTAINEVAA